MAAGGRRQAARRSGRHAEQAARARDAILCERDDSDARVMTRMGTEMAEREMTRMGQRWPDDSDGTEMARREREMTRIAQDELHVLVEYEGLSTLKDACIQARERSLGWTKDDLESGMTQR